MESKVFWYENDMLENICMYWDSEERFVDFYEIRYMLYFER